MSTLAKIFVILNLVLTVLFFGSSAALFFNRENWRESYQNLQKDSDVAIRELEDTFEKRSTLLLRISEERAKLDVRVKELTADNQNKFAEIESLKSNIKDKEIAAQRYLADSTEFKKALQEKERSIGEKDSQIDDLRSKGSAALSAQQKAIDDVTRLMLDYRTLSDLHSESQVLASDLQNKLENYEIVLKHAAESGYDLERMAVPYIDGMIEQVSAKDNLVVVSVGKDQKVLEGYEMFVHRGPDYIGKLKIIRVFDDLSGARVVYTVPSQAIQVGDRVRTIQ